MKHFHNLKIHLPLGLSLITFIYTHMGNRSFFQTNLKYFIQLIETQSIKMQLRNRIQNIPYKFVVQNVNNVIPFSISHDNR